MKFSIILLCIVLGLFAFVDATVVERRSELLKKRAGKGGNRQFAGKGAQNGTTPPPPAPPPVDASGGKKGGNGGKAAVSAPAPAPAATAPAPAATLASSSKNTNGGGGGTGTQNDASTCLLSTALQTGSQNNGEFNLTAGQTTSDTDPANFINFCAGKNLTNGLQIVTGSCNGIPLGDIPAKTQMPSSMITFPAHNQDITANTSFNITSTLVNLAAGDFTNAASTYYSAPTKLNAQGVVSGHTHMTVQDLGGSFNPSQPLDASTFVFFHGIDTAQTGDNELSATVANGLPPGFYRVCTMVSNANHSPLQMPVAQRGGQDDCKYFSAGQGTNQANTTPTTPAPAPPASGASGSAPAPGASGKAAGGAGTGKKGGSGKGRGGRRQ